MRASGAVSPAVMPLSMSSSITLADSARKIVLETSAYGRSGSSTTSTSATCASTASASRKRSCTPGCEPSGTPLGTPRRKRPRSGRCGRYS